MAIRIENVLQGFLCVVHTVHSFFIAIYFKFGQLRYFNGE